VKSDGSSLYMSRDIAAAIDRRTRFGFDRMIYVVDNSQAGHFSNLFTILNKVCKYQGSGSRSIRFVFGPPGSGSGLIVICTDPDPLITSQKNKKNLDVCCVVTS
jgi:hypothetical protein